MNDFETKSYFNQLAEKWDRNPIEPEKDFQLMRMLNRLKIRPDACILDAGCGTGRLFHLIGKIISATTPFYAMDNAFQMAQQARGKRVLNMYPLCGDAQRLPFKDDQFEVILAFGLFPHIQDKKIALSEFRRVLKRDGKLVIFHLKGSQALNAFHQQIGGIVGDHYLPPLPEMKSLFQEADFVIEIGEDHPEEYFCVGVKK